MEFRIASEFRKFVINCIFSRGDSSENSLIVRIELPPGRRRTLFEYHSRLCLVCRILTYKNDQAIFLHSPILHNASLAQTGKSSLLKACMKSFVDIYTDFRFKRIFFSKSQPRMRSDYIARFPLALFIVI